MILKRTYEVAGHNFCLMGERLCRAADGIEGFRPFETDGGRALFSFVEGKSAPAAGSELYGFRYEDVDGKFFRITDGFMLLLKPEGEDALYLWCQSGGTEVYVCGNLTGRLLRFALWVGYGLMTLPYDTVAVHSSCIVYRDKAVLFLGESGTGKSTHTRLWREYIPGAILLNDDSPIIRVEHDAVWAYGSPWSGKTPCYKKERYELKGCVRLSQAPFNRITKLSVLQAYGAIHPSCPPEFAYDDELYDHVGSFLNKLIGKVPFYHLSCLPDGDAADLSCKTLFRE